MTHSSSYKSTSQPGPVAVDAAVSPLLSSPLGAPSTDTGEADCLSNLANRGCTRVLIAMVPAKSAHFTQSFKDRLPVLNENTDAVFSSVQGNHLKADYPPKLQGAGRDDASLRRRGILSLET